MTKKAANTVYFLKVPVDYTCEPYRTLEQAQKAMAMAMDYYIYNRSLENEDVTKECHEYHGDLKIGNAIVVHFDIVEKQLNNFEQWKV